MEPGPIVAGPLHWHVTLLVVVHQAFLHVDSLVLPNGLEFLAQSLHLCSGVALLNSPQLQLLTALLLPDVALNSLQPRGGCSACLSAISRGTFRSSLVIRLLCDGRFAG